MCVCVCGNYCAWQKERKRKQEGIKWKKWRFATTFKVNTTDTAFSHYRSQRTAALCHSTAAETLQNSQFPPSSDILLPKSPSSWNFNLDSLFCFFPVLSFSSSPSSFKVATFSAPCPRLTALCDASVYVAVANTTNTSVCLSYRDFVFIYPWPNRLETKDQRCSFKVILEKKKNEKNPQNWHTEWFSHTLQPSHRVLNIKKSCFYLNHLFVSRLPSLPLPQTLHPEAHRERSEIPSLLFAGNLIIQKRIHKAHNGVRVCARVWCAKGCLRVLQLLRFVHHEYTAVLEVIDWWPFLRSEQSHIMFKPDVKAPAHLCHNISTRKILEQKCIHMNYIIFATTSQGKLCI